MGLPEVHLLLQSAPRDSNLYFLSPHARMAHPFMHVISKSQETTGGVRMAERGRAGTSGARILNYCFVETVMIIAG